MPAVFIDMNLDFFSEQLEIIHYFVRWNAGDTKANSSDRVEKLRFLEAIVS